MVNPTTPRSLNPDTLSHLQSKFLAEYPDTISDSLNFCQIKGHSLTIKLKKDAQPVFTTSTRAIPLHWLPEAKTMIKELINNDIITKVHHPTEWLAPAFFCLKPDGKRLRFVTDFSGLNKWVIRNTYSFFSSKEIIQRLPPNSQFFASMDLLHGFFQVEIQPQSRKYLNFLLPSELGPHLGGKFTYKKCPMGLSTSSDDFCRITDACLFSKGPLHDDRGRVLKLVDDILIASPSLSNLVSLLEDVLSRLKEAQIKVSKKKFKIAERVPFAGFTVSAAGISPDPQRLESLKKLPAPKSRKELRGFIGAIQTLQIFQPHLSSILRPMMELLSTKRSYSWCEAQEKAFEKTKDVLCSRMNLDYYDPNKPTCLLTDASNLGIAAALCQRCTTSGKYFLIMCQSRCLSSPETRYSTSEKEMLAATWGMKKHGFFLLGISSFELIVDHRSLCGIFSKPINELPSARLTNMRLKVAHFNCRVVFNPGKLHLLPDYFSRNAVARPEPEDEVICNLIGTMPIDPKIEKLRNSAIDDKEYQDLLRALRENKNPHTDPKHPAFQYQSVWKDISEDNGLLFLHDRIIIPKNARKHILTLIHRGHKGNKAAQLVSLPKYYWPSIKHDIRQFMKECEGCSSHLPAQAHQDIHMEMARYPFETLGVDPWETSKHKFITVVDKFSSFVWNTEIKSPNADVVIKFLESLFHSLAFQPRFLRCDSASYFLNQTFRSWAESWDITLQPSSPHFHSSNGLVERNLARVKQCIEKNDGVLSKEVKLHIMEINNTPIHRSGLTPSEMLFGFTVRSSLPASEGVHKPVNRHEAIVRKSKALAAQCASANKTSKNLSLLRIGQKCRILSQNSLGRKTWHTKGVIHDIRDSNQSYVVKYLDRNGHPRQAVRNRIYLRPCSTKRVSFANPLASPIPAKPPHDSSSTTESTPLLTPANINQSRK